ncbi:MAG: hypothetical protein ABIE03_02010 [Patescibacteria group bacterium]|nr:hypothetical protein [Patescibacteria group bacterium]
MNKGYKLLFLLILLVITIAAAVYMIKTNNKVIIPKEIGSELTQSECSHRAEEYLVGEWANLPSENPILLNLVLSSDKTFVYNVDETSGSKKYKLSGKWEYSSDTVSMRLNFDELNETWENILSDPKLSDNYESVLSYDLASRLMVVKIQYMEREVFQGCEPNRYYIDLLGYFLYKVSG